MSPQEKARVKRDADKGDASAQRLLDFVAAMEDTIDRARGASAARMLIGEHDDVYGGLIDEMLGGLIPAILVAVDITTMAEFIESMRWYIPAKKAVRHERRSIEQEAENQGKEAQRFKQTLAAVLSIVVSRGQGEYDEDELATIEDAYRLVPDQFPCWDEDEDDDE